MIEVMTQEQLEELYRQNEQFRKDLGIPDKPEPLTEERVREIVREELAATVIPDWLDEVVTDEAKKDPDWRAKARSCRGSFRIKAGEQETPQPNQS